MTNFRNPLGFPNQRNEAVFAKGTKLLLLLLLLSCFDIELKKKKIKRRERAYKVIVRSMWCMLLQSGIPMRRAARLVLGDYINSMYSSVFDMIGKLGWRTLEQWRADSRLVVSLITPGHRGTPQDTLFIV